MLKDFTLLLPELYDCKDCTLNAHLLNHLCDDARCWGALWCFSAFPFENKNGYLMGHVHSPHRIADQLLFSIHLSQKLDTLEKELLNTQPDSALSFLGLKEQLSGNGHVLLPGSYGVGCASMSKLTDEEKVQIEHVIRDCPMEALHFTRIYHQDTIFTSLKYGKSDSKRNSSVCSFLIDGTEKHGTIESFYMIRSIPVAIIKPYVRCVRTFLSTIGSSGRQILDEYASLDLLGTFVSQVNNNQSSSIIAIKLQSITSKCIIVHPKSSQSSFIVKIPNNYECH